MSLPTSPPDDVPVAVPRRLLEFLRARLDEEILARGGDAHPGVQLLRQAVVDLAAGRRVPGYVAGTLVVGYGRHPRFDAAWTAVLHRSAD